MFDYAHGHTSDGYKTWTDMAYLGRNGMAKDGNDDKEPFCHTLFRRRSYQ